MPSRNRSPMREWKTRSNAGRQSRAMRLACSGLALVPARHTTQAPCGTSVRGAVYIYPSGPIRKSARTTSENRSRLPDFSPNLRAEYNCNGGVTPQRVWCMAALKLTKPTRAISASGALVAHDRRAQTSEGIHARPQRHPSLTRHAPVAREARDSCERGHTAATPPRPVSDRFWPLRGRADASARDGPHRAHRQRERRCPDARVAREDRSRSHTAHATL